MFVPSKQGTIKQSDMKILKTSLLLLLSYGTALKAQISVHLANGCNSESQVIQYESYPLTFDPADEAKEIVHYIIEAAGVRSNFELRFANIQKVVATTDNDKRYLLYSNALLERLDHRNSYWGAYFMLAHEIGHHLKKHDFGETDPYRIKYDELDADVFAGSALCMLGATLLEAQEAVQSLSMLRKSETRPSKSSRLEAMTLGWERQHEKLNGELFSHPAKERYLAVSTVGVGQGSGGKPGNGGIPTGTGDNPFGKSSGTGGGSGGGDGTGTGVSIGGGLSGRAVVQRSRVNNTSQKIGKVVIEICVNSNGSVTSAEYTLRGSTSNDSELKAQAIQAALGYRFAASTADQERGTITFNFQVESVTPYNSSLPNPVNYSNQNNYAQMPNFPWPPPNCYQRKTLVKNLGSKAQDLNDIDERLQRTLDHAGYYQRSYYQTPGGFALATQMEQFEEDGSIKKRWRWAKYPVQDDFDDVWTYLKSLVMPNPGRFRVFVFVVTDQAYPSTEKMIAPEGMQSLATAGFSQIPSSYSKTEVTSSHYLEVLIYEFEAPQSTKRCGEKCPGYLDVQTHLLQSGLSNINGF